MPSPRRSVATAAVAVAVAAMVALAGCGGGEQHVALAIQEAERADGVVELTVECAEGIEVERRADPAGSGLEQVTVWGDPKVGTCRPDATVAGLTADRFVDGASSQVIHVG